MRPSSLLQRLLATATLVIVGCAVSPQPSPPGPTLEASLVVPGLTPEAAFEGVVFQGAAGSVEPAEGVVVITNLATTDAPSVAPVASDGSFEIAVPGSLSDVFRLQVKLGAARSEPLDLRADGASFAEVVPGLDDCLTLEPTAWLPLDGEGDARSLVLDNACDVSVAFAAPRLRRGLAGFGLAPTTPFELAPGERTTLTIRADALRDEREDVLLLESPLTLRAITLTTPD